MNNQTDLQTELQQSAIDSQIAALNFGEVGQAEAFNFLVRNPKRRNDGRLTDGHLRTYRLFAMGGWLCHGIDPLTMQPGEWGCLKPYNPRIDEIKRKAIKYEHPHGQPTEVFCLRVTWECGRKIAARAGLEAQYLERMDSAASPYDEDRDFWQWVKDTPEIAIVPTEGSKKAASLLSAGYCAIGLPGIYGGYRAQREGQPCLPYLIPQLKVFTQPGREFVFAFDRDTNPKTIAAVRQATDKTGRLLERSGCKVSVMAWTHAHKGVDDLIYHAGAAVLDAIYADRLSLDNWRLQGNFSLDRYDAVRINSRYLDPAVGPDKLEGKIVGVKSAKGTGKTEWLARQVERYINDGRGVLILTHRVQLAQALAERLGIPHVSEVWQHGQLLGFSLCVDSLHGNSQVKFDPTVWEGAAVVIDEAEQVIWHLLNSNTCQGKRAEILANFGVLLQTIAATGGTVFLTDADLSANTIEYVQKLTGGMPLWLAINDYKPVAGKRTLTLHKSPADLLAAVITDINAGKNIILHCSAQNVKSKWSAQNLETAIGLACPDISTLRCDSDTVADKEHPAYGIVNHLGDLRQYRVVIATSVIETGVSIEGNHFDAVYSLANGVQTVDAVCQTIERVRSDVPRHMAITTGGIGWIGNGGSNPRQLIASQKQVAKFNIAALSQQDAALQLDEMEACHVLAWANYAAKTNAEFRGYKLNIITKLEREGYEIVDCATVGVASLLENRHQENWDECLDEIRDANYTQQRQEIRDTPTPDEVELQRLKKQRGKTKAERLALAKGKLVERYGTDEITDDLIVKDDGGWYPKIHLHYYLIIGREFAAAKDRDRLQSIAHEDRALPMDINRACISGKLQILDALNIKQFFGEDKVFTAENLADWHEWVQRYRGAIKDALGLSISTESNPIQTAQRLLGLFGLRLTYIDQVREGGSRVRRYAGVDRDFDDGRSEIFERWFERDLAARHTIANKSIERGGVTEVAC
jgi:hypothetical protein